ncbi:fatty acid desaturase-domain-containing protein [Dipodascopsis tothii]|uniref:fatty acid desaturase-domain-containing protein n=1 Tax=Dipodascopsis tothii TaxID=44089 RepID=UPI0034CD0519
MAKDNVLSRAAIEQLIHDEHIIVIVDNAVLRLDSWIERHPGGDKVLRHVIGRDATDEFNAYHSEESHRMMRAFQIGRVEGIWENFVPPLHGGKFRCKAELDEAVALSGSSASEASESDDEAGERFDLHKLIASPNKPLPRVRPADSKRPRTEEDVISDFDRRLIEKDLEAFPSLDYETQLEITQQYRALERKLKAEGYFVCNYWNYAIEGSRYVLLGGLAALLLHLGWYMTSAFFLGCMWHQLTFLAHDAGHLAITHHYYLDSLLGGFVANYVGGLSIGWWKRSHNVHHIITNDPEHDPDIQLMPFFAVSARGLGGLYSTFYERFLAYDLVARLSIRFQNFTYYPILCFGRFNLYFLSWDHILRGLGPRKGAGAWIRHYEAAGLAFFWFWYGYVVLWRCMPDMTTRLAYLLVSNIVTMPVHVQITLSHFAMSTADLGASESFAQKMLRTTMDVDCPTWLDFFHGGLQFQAVHHLFPRMPRHNFRSVQAEVIKFCEAVGIEYRIYGFAGGSKEVIGKLGQIAKQASIMAECNRHMVDEALGKAHRE